MCREEKKTAVIISGGRHDDAFIMKYIDLIKCEMEEPYLIASDSGLVWFLRKEMKPALVVGDFDSLMKRLRSAEEWTDIKGRVEDALEQLEIHSEMAEGAESTPVLSSDLSEEEILRYYSMSGCEIRRFRPEKDLTDTQIAVEAAMEKGCTKIHVLGGTGTRIDHMLGNLQVMELCLEKGAQMILADPCNRITMHDRPFEISAKELKGDYVSFVPWGGPVRDLTLRGFKYPLDAFTLKTDQSLAISNEMAGERASVSFAEGRLLMIESND